MCKIAGIRIRFVIIHGKHSHETVCVFPNFLYLTIFTAWTMNGTVLLPFCCWPFTGLTFLTIQCWVMAAWIMAAMTCIVARLKWATKKSVSCAIQPTICTLWGMSVQASDSMKASQHAIDSFSFIQVLTNSSGQFSISFRFNDCK